MAANTKWRIVVWGKFQFIQVIISVARSVTCPKPVRNIFGHLHSVESISGKNHVVRLLEYVPGELLKDVPRSETLYYQLGEFVANLDNKLVVCTYYAG